MREPQELAAALLRAGRSVTVRAGGRSMEPLLRDGDLLRVEPAEAAALAVGQVILVRRTDGHLLAHRLVARRQRL